MKRLVSRTLAAIAAGLLVATGGWIGIHHFAYALSPPARRALIKVDAATLQGDGVLLVGDSRTELLGAKRLCGKRLVRAGYSGEGLRFMASQATDLAKVSRPRIVIFAGGVNDALEDRRFTPAEWSQSLSRLSRAFAQRGAQEWFVSVVPPAPKGPRGARLFEMNRLDQMNALLQRTGHYINAKGLMQDRSSGLLRQDLTLDGVHFSPAGERLWIKAMNQACGLGHDH